MKMLAEDFEPFDPDDGRNRPFAPPDATGLDERQRLPHEAEEPLRRNNAEASAAAEALPVVAADRFAHLPTPQRHFLVPGANLLPGATSRPSMAMAAPARASSPQFAVAVASGTSWLGFMPEHGGCLYLSAEDDEDETHVRLKSIVEGSEARFAMLQNLHIAILAGQDAVLAHEDARAAG